ncbi:protein ITPRID1 [Bombina bombina]|uniref:protein ITPRID1 n=1 Tax=Bombina bombina TaxID=8345 RepID=UPI00235A7807|nr:protein ITPRID1 [Bombina bombina]
MHSSKQPTEDKQCLPEIQRDVHEGLKTQINSKNDLGVETDGFISKMGLKQMSVSDYMSALHNYLETPPVSRSDTSILQAFSYPKSIPELLRLCEVDPVDLLLDLGFGVDEPDICTRIPSRFIMTPSEAKGINIRVFLEAQKKRMDIENPNVCGRFRQLEVLEQVTNAFSSLLNDVHAIQNGGTGDRKGTRKSTLTEEKRKRIQQLLWNYSKQAIKNEQDCIQCPSKIEPKDNKYDQKKILTEMNSNKVFRKTRKRIPEIGSLVEQTGDNTNVPSQNLHQVCSDGAVAKHYKHLTDLPTKSRVFKGSKILPKKFKQISGPHGLQPPESFELEEVQSFEDECPKWILNGCITDGEMRRTNSCQSDSSGFQEDPSEPLPLQNLHESLNLSSDSIDSQATLIGKHCSLPFQEENNNMTCNFLQESKANKETDPEVLVGVVRLSQELKLKDQEDEVDIDAQEFQFPVYMTHYLSKEIEHQDNINHDDEHDEMGLDSNLERCVSELQDANYTENSDITDVEIDDYYESSIYSSDTTRTPSPLNDHLRSSHQTLADDDSVDFLKAEPKYTFQTELNTNIYKSVTIQMSPNLMSDFQNTDCLSRQHSFCTANSERNGYCVENLNAQKKEAFSQTDMEMRGHCCTDNHCMVHGCCLLTESLSFDTGLWHLNHAHHHQTLRCMCSHCCHCCIHCHCHCSRFPPIYKHNKSTIEKELTDTLKLLKESLTNVSVHTDCDLENMKKACQTFRDKLIEIEQLLIEQQAGCWNTFSNEGWEEIRRLHMLRRSVLQEVLELEFRLGERAWHVKETISQQLEQVLEEQSRLYSELDLSKWEPERKNFDHNCNSQSVKNFAASADYDKFTQESPLLKTKSVENENEELLLPQKRDFSAILQNIKKTFRSFHNS